jgi:hypothetical protein
MGEIIFSKLVFQLNKLTNLSLEVKEKGGIFEIGLSIYFSKRLKFINQTLIFQSS